MIKEVFGGTDLDFGMVESAQTVGSICSILGVTFLEKRFGISKNIGIGTYGVFFRTFYQQTVDTALLGRFLSVMAMIFAVGRLAA